ncbi:MAG: NAD(P)-dependent oxidoreductase [Candidatus Pacearchaeota archaeon]|nr:NAD(P)-dependent oxidoreductase [Candidatus Pacearchaeota archaeon]
MILITGASGFIGSHLAEELTKRKEKVRVLVRNLNEIGYIHDFSKEIRNKIEIVEGDLLDKTSLIKALKGTNKVFHLAAISRPMNIPKQKYFDVNLYGTRNLLEACKKQKIKKIIHVSSMSVFGFSRDRNSLTENSSKLPVSYYGESKKQGEELAIDFCKKNKIKLIVVRPPMVFGPRDSQFLRLFKLIDTGFFPLLKKGQAKLEFCYVKNLVNGILLADKYGKNLESYNISDGETYTIKEVFGKIAEAENKKLFPISIPVWSVKASGLIIEKVFLIFKKKAPFNSGTAEWMSKDNVIDISKAKKKLKYKRLIPLEEGIKETVEWYKARRLL